MRIGANYTAWLSRVLAEDKSASEASKSAQTQEATERKETSRLMNTVQQELEKIEQNPDSQQAQRLQSLKEDINAGTYRVDTQELATAMLDERV